MPPNINAPVVILYYYYCNVKTDCWAAVNPLWTTGRGWKSPKIKSVNRALPVDGSDARNQLTLNGAAIVGASRKLYAFRDPAMCVVVQRGRHRRRWHCPHYKRLIVIIITFGILYLQLCSKKSSLPLLPLLLHHFLLRNVYIYMHQCSGSLSVETK